MGFPISDAEHAAIKARIDGQPELIVSAAIRVGPVIVMVERPGRHGDCINFLHRLGIEHLDQGFVTNHGRFVDRLEAAAVVVAAGQATPRTQCNGHLFSEDVWNDSDREPHGPIHPASVFGSTEQPTPAVPVADYEQKPARSVEDAEHLK